MGLLKTELPPVRKNHPWYLQALIIGIFLAATGWLLSNYLAGLSTIRQIERLPNPDGSLEAIEYVVQDFSTTPAYYNIDIVLPGKSINPARWAVGSTDSIKANGEHGYDLRWIGPNELEVSYWQGNVDVEKDYKAGVWPRFRHITIITKREYPPGVSDFVDPPRHR